ncbi:hypothetical protein RD792_010147 [Penstemon davidsonii]|uniref:Alcohol dehydrogenase-like N-terminal domain-containing protein n=1 Tax=Penstemon davidsonii TaxID=160366 RepID=A0ABR0D150_9LAMI|nr:hypothetical protein RD792_010147 [Penstemon davidsonii]
MAPKLMQALKYDGSGNGSVGLKQAEIPVPSPYKDEVLLKLEATSLNPVDWKTHKLKVLLNPLFPRKFPLVPATDVAGEVVEVGPGVKNFKPGDKVVAMTGGLSTPSQKKSTQSTDPLKFQPPKARAFQSPPSQHTQPSLNPPKSNSTKTPPKKTSSSPPLPAASATTPYSSQSSETTTCGARNIVLVKNLGADEVLDYNTPEGESLKSPSGRKYDAVIHCAEARRAWSTFEPNLSGDGVVVDLSPGGSDFLRYGLQRVWFSKKKLVFLFVGVVNEELKYMVDLVKEGKIKCVIDFKCCLSEDGDAWRKMISGHATGKIVVEQ